MIELGQIARGVRLGGLLAQPWLQSFNGVEGIALSYDERLVTEVNRLVLRGMPDEWRGTVEHSRYVALFLATVARAFEDEQEIGDDHFTPFDTDYLASRWWKWVRDADEHYRSPIVVEVIVGKNFGREVRPELSVFENLYRVRIRHSHGAQLHGAAAGGRIDARIPGRPRIYGTLGGFVVDDLSRDIFGVTAAHVCRQTTGYARPLPLPHAHELLRRGAWLVLGSLGLARHRREDCPWRWESAARVVPMPQCTVEANPSVDGIDVALHSVHPQSGLQSVSIANLRDISPVLELSFIGAKSGYQRARVTSYSLWHSYELNGVDVCIHDCLQIKADAYGRPDVSRRGDSGAWLLARGEYSLYWVGLLTGGDGYFAGIVPATRILDCVKRDFGLSVQAYV